MSRPFCLLSTLFALSAALGACVPGTPPVDVNVQVTKAVQTAFASIRGTQAASKPLASQTPAPAPTALRTPPALPAPFVAASLNPLDTPHAYIQNSCEYLKDKWSSTNSAPGTVVMVVMFHSISKAAATDANQISDEDFGKLMRDLHDGGFTAINMQQLNGFLYSNALIPPRSVLLVVDDRHQAQSFTDHFLPYFEKYKWPVINGWISAFGGADTVLAENVALEKEGWVDHEAHGVIHNIPMSDSSSDGFLTGELEGSITNMQQYFQKTPIAIIWPGGGFGVRPVQFARKFGYRLGFTINPRGPIMFNWIPLADQADPRRPYFIPEGPVNDPLMVLPRFWDVDARAHLDQVRQISNDAAAYALQNKSSELQYYDIVCAPTLGRLP